MYGTIRKTLLPIISIVLAGAMSCIAASGAFAASGFNVNPMRFDINGLTAGGASTKKTITIQNTYGGAMTFKISKEDFGGSKSDPNAAPVLYGSIVDSPISGAKWLTPSTSTLTIPAGGSKSFTVTAQAPSGASGGHYGAITIAASSQDIGDTVKVRSQVAVLFLMNSGTTPPPELVVNDVTVTEDGKVIVDYVNEGTTAAEPTVRVVYVDPITGEKTAVVSGTCDTTTLPDSVGQCELETGAAADSTSVLRSGTVELVADGARTKAKLPTEWSGGTSSLVLPGAGIAIVSAYFLSMRRRRSFNELDGFVDDLL